MPDPVVRLLVRHQWLRDHGTPRLTVLVGDPRRARQIWTRWLELSGRAAAAPELPAELDDAIARASAAPGEPIAVAVSVPGFERWSAAAEDRHRAFAGEGVIQIAEPIAPLRGTIDSARSLAELTLFEALEATRWSAGRFRLNQRLPFRFGTTDVEVDLLSRDDQLVIEIDGIHHFADADAYRRDRHKDLLLQAHGFAVVRFLAEDVARDPRAALNRISEYLGHKLRREGAR